MPKCLATLRKTTFMFLTRPGIRTTNRLLSLHWSFWAQSLLAIAFYGMFPKALNSYCS